MADYPTAIPNYGPDEIDNVDYNYAAHINKLRAENLAIAVELGTRGANPTSIGTRLAGLVTDVATLKGHFDVSGKLPHTGVQGVQVGGFANPETTWDNFYPFGNASAGWRVTAAGMCEWFGAITVGFQHQAVVLTGAPAPADAKTHSFKIRRGITGGYNLIPVGGGFIAFADYAPQTSAMSRPQWFVDEGGVCHVSGSVLCNTVPAMGGVVLDGLPPALDGGNKVFQALDLGYPSSGFPFVTFDSATGSIVTGSVVRGSGGTSIGVYGGFSGGLGGGPGFNFAAGHAYSIELEYQCNNGGVSMDVLSDGTGYYNGPNVTPPGTPPYSGGEYIWLDGISYFVGPGSL